MADLLDENDDSLEALELANKRRNRTATILIVGALLVFLIGGGFFASTVMFPGIGEHIEKVMDGELDVFGDRLYTPEHDVSVEEFEKNVDIEKVHAKLLPHWLIALSYDDAGYPSDETLAEFEALQKAVKGDPNLHALVTELGELIHSEKVAEHTERIHYLTWAWNDYLRQMDQPYHFEAVIMYRQDGPMLYTKNYGLVGEVDFELGEDKLTGLLAERIDNTNIVENYLCRATESDERPLWIVDTSADEAAEHVWPMLSADSDPTLEPLQRGFAVAMRNEAKEVLSKKSFQTLQSTAHTRHQLLSLVDDINERDCNKFRISYKPLIAYDLGRLDRLWDDVTYMENHPCPRLTSAELEKLIALSKELHAKTDELRPAIEELTAWIARPRLVHEVRHRADEDRHMARDLPMSCPGCETGVSPRYRAELSGYLAGVAYTDAPVAGLFRACWVHENSSTYHRLAMEPLVRELASSQNCENGPVDNLGEKAKKADVELFDRDEPISVIGKWPEKMKVSDW